MEEVLNQNQGAAFIMLPKSALEALTNGIEEVKALIKGQAKAEIQKEWLESEEARKFIAVSPKTWQTYRDKRLLPFSQFGRKIYVRRADLEAFLEAHIVRN